MDTLADLITTAAERYGPRVALTLARESSSESWTYADLHRYARRVAQLLQARGIAPGSLLDPAMHARIPSDTLASAHAAIAGALTWVFLGMAVFAICGIFVTALMRQTRCEHPVKRSEGLEALAG